jgi:site-specific recombinase XerD
MSQGTAMSVKQSRVLRSKAGRRTTFLRAVAAATYERAAGRSVHERATERLRQASAQRLRHTAGSHMMDRQVDLRYVRDNLGHESISTTSQYLHADDDDRHRATEAGLRLNW